MAALNFADLSKPVSDADPCGPDLEDDIDFMNVMARLEVALPSSYFRRDDEGRQVAFDRTSIEFPAAFADVGKLLERTRDLRVLVLAAKLSILNRDVPGFSACLSTMADLLGAQWEAVHPRAMDGDYVMREVALQGLDELATVVLPLQHAPLFTSRRIGAFAFRSQLVASGETRLVEGEEHPEAATIQVALREADPADLAMVLGHVETARDALARLRMVWLDRVGANHPLGFPRLTALLDQMAGFLGAAAARRLPGDQVAGAATEVAAPQMPAASASNLGPGGLSSILQVKDTLAACLGYFRKTEPSSPAVLLIGQAQQLIGKSLIEVIQIMFPEHVDKAVFAIGEPRRFRLPLERLPAPSGYDEEVPLEAEEPEEVGTDSEMAAGERGEAGNGEDDAGADMPVPAAAARGASAAIQIANRAEAVAAMKAVAAFYRQAEPSHPMPLLMDKACALAQHDFMSLIGNILPEVTQMPEDEN